MNVRSFVVVLVSLLGWQPVVAAVPPGPGAFDTDSATLSHPYFPVGVGDVTAYSGYGDYRGDLTLDFAVGVETLDGVECLVLARERYWSRWDNEAALVEEFYSIQWYWLAEDVEGNVWTLGFADWDGTSYYFGATTPVLEMPAVPQVGDAWQNLYGRGVEVLSVASILGQLRNGLGPFSDCVHLRIAWGGSDIEDRYYAPTLGMAYSSYDDGGVDEGWERVPTAAPVPGPGSLQFSADSFSAAEGRDWFQAQVTRTGGSDGVVSFRREVTESVAATNPGRFNRDQRIVYLAPGQSSLTFDVWLNNDDFWSHERTMILELSAPGGGASLGTPSTATVNVEDDEEGSDPGEFIGPCFLETLKLW